MVEHNLPPAGHALRHVTMARGGTRLEGPEQEQVQRLGQDGSRNVVTDLLRVRAGDTFTARSSSSHSAGAETAARRR